MLRGSRRVSWRTGAMTVGVLTALALGLAAPLGATGSAAAAAAPAGKDAPVLLGSTPASAAAGSGVSSGTANTAVRPAKRTRPPALSVRVTDPAAAASARRTSTGDSSTAGDGGGGYACTESIDTFTGGIGEDDFLEETVRVDYFAFLDCNFYLASIEGIAGVLDRSESFNGENFDGRVLGTGTYEYREWDYQAQSFGAIGVRAREYNGARRIEAAYELYLLAPEGIIWDACNPVPGLRYLVCEGLGTDYLHVVMGTGPFNTGLTKACRDQRAPLDAEQARLFLPAGSTPASTHILRRIAAVKNEVTSFKRALCAVTGAADAFADGRGLQLWNVATASARAGAAAGDDRPLYWARLSMTSALSQWRPTFGVNHAVLQTRLDRSSRGMTTHGFGGSAKKVFVSGFDPFELDANIYLGNPSGAAALRLDGTTDANGREIQAVVFPVRYADFDAGLVEEVFRPHLQPGAQQASVITTVSQGGNRFDLEVYNGRRRAGHRSTPNTASLDNRRVSGIGTYNNPVLPAVAPGAEFVPTSLPVHKMVVNTTDYTTVINHEVHQKATPTSPTLPSSTGPTDGYIAVHGGGGGLPVQ